MTFFLITLFIGLSLILSPTLFTAKSALKAQQRRVARLSELEAGADEAYFEEHRALKVYRAKTNPWIYRGIGAALIIWALISYREYLS